MSTTRDDLDHPDPNLESMSPTESRIETPGGGFLRGRALPAIAAILSVALLGGALYALDAGHGIGTTRSATPTATSIQPTPTLSPAPPTATPLPQASQRWTKAGQPYFYGAVAVAPSQPATLYSCGQLPNSNGDPSAPSYLGVSHDGGKTWKTSLIPAYCAALRVSPTNPQDVAFEGTVCGSASGCVAPSPGSPSAWVYSSTDGSAHWALAKLPPNTIDMSQVPEYFIAWTGTTLYVAPNVRVNTLQPLPPGTHLLAASANGGPFSWVDQNGLSARVPDGTTLDLLIGVGNTLYVHFGARLANGPCVVPRCSGVATTSDGGATWGSIGYTYQGAPLVAITGIAGRDVIAHPGAIDYPTGPPLRSTDGGESWSALPVLPGDLSATFEMPDGTLFASTSGNGSLSPTHILLPGTGAWALVAPAVNDAGTGGLAAVSWDANGHPLLLWGAVFGLGLYSHPA